MKSSREMTEDILVRRDEYVALKRRKMRMFTGSSATVLGFAVIVTGSTMLINSGVMDSHVPVDTSLGISVSEEAPASQVPVKKETERLVRNSSEMSVPLNLSSGERAENTQPDIISEVQFAGQAVTVLSDTSNANYFTKEAASSAVSTVPTFEKSKDSKVNDKESVSDSLSKTSITTKESSTKKSEEPSSEKDIPQTAVSSVSSVTQISEAVSVSEPPVSSVESVSDSIISSESSAITSASVVSESAESVSSSVSALDSAVPENGTEKTSYVYYDLTSDEENDDTLFEDINEVQFENRTYKSVPFTVEEMAKFMEYLPSNEQVENCDVYYVRKMHMIALVKNRSLALYSLCMEDNNIN